MTDRASHATTCFLVAFPPPVPSSPMMNLAVAWAVVFAAGGATDLEKQLRKDNLRAEPPKMQIVIRFHVHLFRRALFEHGPKPRGQAKLVMEASAWLIPVPLDRQEIGVA